MRSDRFRRFRLFGGLFSCSTGSDANCREYSDSSATVASGSIDFTGATACSGPGPNICVIFTDLLRRDVASSGLTKITVVKCLGRRHRQW